MNLGTADISEKYGSEKMSVTYSFNNFLSSFNVITWN